MTSLNEEVGQSTTSHFDRRGATYDRDDAHHRIALLLLAGVDLKSGFRVLDIATGTGLLALEVSQRVGPTGTVVAIDVSQGMLSEARRKADAAGLRNIDIVCADAERLEFSGGSFDCLFCASALVLMSDISRALHHWFGLLKPGGIIAFDAPAKPFGISQMVADIAAGHGVNLAYATIADTPDKCRSFLEGAGFEVVAIRTEFANTDPIELSKAIEFWDSHRDHPAWQSLNQAQPTTREAIRSEYVDRVTATAAAGYLPNDTALNFAFGRKPA